MTTAGSRCAALRTGVKAAGPGVLGAFCVAGLVLGAHAATVQVEVLDAAGKPLADAVVFLESPEARKAVRPLAGAEMAQEKRQFVPGVLVVPWVPRCGSPTTTPCAITSIRFRPRQNSSSSSIPVRPPTPCGSISPGWRCWGATSTTRWWAGSWWWPLHITPAHRQRQAGRRSTTCHLAPTPCAPGTRTWHARLPVGAPAQEQALTVPATGGAVATVRLAGLQP